MLTNNKKSILDLLKDYIGPKRGICEEEVSYLIPLGENYCSVIYKVDVSIENLENGSKEAKHYVAKCLRADCNENFKSLFPMQFGKEIGFYFEILPQIRQFQLENNISEIFDIFPTGLAYRSYSEDGAEKIDESTVIITENLNATGKLRSVLKY